MSHGNTRVHKHSGSTHHWRKLGETVIPQFRICLARWEVQANTLHGKQCDEQSRRMFTHQELSVSGGKTENHQLIQTGHTVYVNATYNFRRLTALKSKNRTQLATVDEDYTGKSDLYMILTNRTPYLQVTTPGNDCRNDILSAGIPIMKPTDCTQFPEL